MLGLRIFFLFKGPLIIVRQSQTSPKNTNGYKVPVLQYHEKKLVIQTHPGRGDREQAPAGAAFDIETGHNTGPLQ